MITIISHWYNEELLAPLFLNHYDYVDKIYILLETDTSDKTREICLKYSNVFIEDVHCPDGLNDRDMIDKINQTISNIKEGWIYVAYPDEFIFPENFEDARVFLERQTANVVRTLYWHVYKHHTENDVDYTKKPVPQRVHGYQLRRGYEGFSSRPNVFKASAGMILGIGTHSCIGKYSFSNERFIGSHWKMADFNIAMRRISNRNRMSQANKKRGYGNHEYNMTEERIKDQIKRFSDAPIIHEFLPKEKICQVWKE